MSFSKEDLSLEGLEEVYSDWWCLVTPLVGQEAAEGRDFTETIDQQGGGGSHTGYLQTKISRYHTGYLYSKISRKSNLEELM